MAGNYLVGRSEASGGFVLHRTLTNGNGSPLLVSVEEAARMAREIPYLSDVFEAELFSDSEKPEDGNACVVCDVCRRDRENKVWIYRPLTGEDGKPLFMSEEDAKGRARGIYENDTRGPLPVALDAGPLFGYETGMKYVPCAKED